MFDETLNTIEHLIGQIWSLRCAARIADAEKGVKRLNELFAYYEDQLPPPSRLEGRFQLLHIQVQRLNAVTLLENKQYDQAISTFEKMLDAAKRLDNAATTALALNELGKELERKGDKEEAVALLEEARDASLRAGKLAMAFVHSYLARVYASAGDARRFERTIETGLTIAHHLGSYPDGTDFVYSWSPISSILAEKSWGYLNIRQPKQTLAMKKEIEQAILMGQDARLHAWIPLDWARAYLMLGEVEAGIDAVREFYTRVTAMRSPHAIVQTFKYLDELEAAGYGDVQAVRDFQMELRTTQH
jgi:tetratricopeptide (TPR) repeat protein